ncbi:MAG: PRD domain-containing protein [Firmicutes bacterium]|uniref:Transcriptional antiterminator n=1 Tax=Melghirimyces thermohalophilus TaxID=1236220 RepID=A0A1G6QLF3_9BACL|nr:PRD domain-containing protein [Melghirimyces thermohalophilus]MDA8353968.1 PRD domain-containing protein [Bacillota bacterium]SDC93133.1 Transcriptional antiterminator [Melghirimyces thermohalophilus]
MEQTLTPRQRSLGRYLLSRKQYETVRSLSARFDVSPRTVRYDLDQLEDWFQAHELELERRPRRGVRVNGVDSARQSAEEGLGEIRPPAVVAYSKEDRLRHLIISLLQRPEKLTVDELAQEIDVSRGTLLKDLNEAEAWLANHGVSVIRVPGFGIRLQTDEFHWRQAAAALMSESWTHGEVKAYLRKHREEVGRTEGSIREWLSREMIREVESVLFQWDSPTIQALSDLAYQSLVVHIGLAVLRLRQGNKIVMPEVELSELMGLPEFEEAKRLTALLGRQFDVSIPEDEIGYIVLHLLGAQRMRTSVDMKASPPLEHYVDSVIHVVSETLQLPLSRDPELREGLMIHMKPAMARIRYHLSIDNPVLSQVRSRYPRVYAACQKAAFQLEKEIGAPIPPGEIGYMAMHVGAAATRLHKNSVTVKRGLLVCASGVGTAKMLQSHLQKEIPEVSWVGVYSVIDVEGAVKQTGADFAVSTLPLDASVAGIPVFILSSVPGHWELERLREELLLGSTGLGLSVDELVKRVEEYATIHDPDGLKKAIQQSLMQQQRKPPPTSHLFQERTGDDPMLDQLLKEETMMLRRSCGDWCDALRQGAAPLLKRGMIEARYVDQIERNLKEHGAYMVIAPGIALLHARPEDGVNAVCMSLLTLKEPVCFGHPQNDPVQVVITFATLDNDMHLTALSQLMELLSDEQSLKKLREAETRQDAVQVIQKFIP